MLQKASKSIRIAEEHYRELELLKLAWRCPTFNAVLERLLVPYRLERIKAVGIKVESNPGEK